MLSAVLLQEYSKCREAEILAADENDTVVYSGKEYSSVKQ